MTWQQACDWVDDIVERHPDQDDVAPFPALQWLDREMLEAERQLDCYEDENENETLNPIRARPSLLSLAGR